MFKDLPIWADALLRVIAILFILGLIVFFSLVFLSSCSSEESYHDVSDWKYIGSATFSHLEYKSISLIPYTIYYMQNGKVYPVIEMRDGFERGQLVHIYRIWTVDGYEYKVFEDPIYKVKAKRRKEK